MRWIYNQAGCKVRVPKLLVNEEPLYIGGGISARAITSLKQQPVQVIQIKVEEDKKGAQS